MRYRRLQDVRIEGVEELGIRLLLRLRGRTGSVVFMSLGPWWNFKEGRVQAGFGVCRAVGACRAERACMVERASRAYAVRRACIGCMRSFGV